MLRIHSAIPQRARFAHRVFDGLFRIHSNAHYAAWSWIAPIGF